MKTMTCNQLGGACEETFTAETFDEMAELSQKHGQANMEDPAHQEAMNKMRGLMANPADMQAWMDGRRAAFETLDED